MESKGVGYVTNLIVGTQGRVDLKGEECRRYGSVLKVRGHLGHQPTVSTKYNTYEIKSRLTITREDGKRSLSLPEWRANIKKQGSPLDVIDGGYLMAENYKAELEECRPRNAFTPDWSVFNFDGIVYVLSALIATASIDPTYGTKDLRQEGGKVEIAGFVREEDIQAVASNAVYVPHAAGYHGSGRAYCALVHAASYAGALVLTDYISLDAAGSPRINDISGGILIESCCEALGVLANIYDAAGRGDSFSVALVKGLNTILSVVGHSDEGGFLRDVLREGDYCVPKGGIPTRVPAWCGFSLLKGNNRSALEVWVDQILLVAAAAVAHCDPCVTVSGMVVPTVFYVEDGTDPKRTLSDDEKLAICKTQIGKNFMTFAKNYARALALSLGFGEPHDGLGHSGADQLCNMFDSLKASRHLTSDVVAPYYWIEPTGLLNRNAFGYIHETLDGGSLCGPGEVRIIDYLAGAQQVGRHTDHLSQFCVPFFRARNCGMVLLCQGSAKNGLASLVLNQFDPTSLVLAKKNPEEIAEYVKTHSEGIPISELLWTRGQSSIPHPAELVSLDPSILFTVVHGKGTFTKMEYFDNVPDCQFVCSAKVELYSSYPRRIDNGLVCKESGLAKRARVRAVRAIHTALNAVHDAFEECDSMLEAKLSTYIPPLDLIAKLNAHAPQRFRETEKSRARLPPADLAKAPPDGLISTTSPADLAVGIAGDSVEGKGVPVQVCRIHESVRAPQPDRVVSGQTLVSGRTVKTAQKVTATSPAVAAAGDNQSVGSSDTSVTQPAGGQAAIGAAPGGN